MASGGTAIDKKLLEEGLREYRSKESELTDTVTLPTPTVTGGSKGVRRSARLAKSGQNPGDGNGAK